MKNGFSVELNIGGRILEYDDDKGLLYCKIPQQRMADPKTLSFGIVSNQAEVDLEDFDGKLRKLVADRKINKSTKCKILFNDNIMFYGVVNDSDYSSDNKTLSIKVADPLILLKGTKCKPKEFDNGHDAAVYLMSCAKTKLATFGINVLYHIYQLGDSLYLFPHSKEGEMGFVVRGDDLYNDINRLASTTQHCIYTYKNTIMLKPSVTHTVEGLLHMYDFRVPSDKLLSNVSATLVPDNQIERVDLDIYYNDITERDNESVFKSSNKIEINADLISKSNSVIVDNTYPESLPLPYNGDSIAIRRFELFWSPDITRTYIVPTHQGSSTIVSITDIENAITQNKANVTIGFYGKIKPFSITDSQQKILESLSANGYLLSQKLNYEDGQEGYTDFVELSRWNIGTKTLADYVSLSEDDDGNIIVTSKINPTRIAVVSGTVAFPRGTYPAFAFTNSYELIPEGIALKIKDGDKFHIVSQKKTSTVSYGDTTKDAFTIPNSQFTTSAKSSTQHAGFFIPLDRVIAKDIVNAYSSGRRTFEFNCEFSEYLSSVTEFEPNNLDSSINPKTGQFINAGMRFVFDSSTRKELGIPDAGLASDGYYDATVEQVDVINDRGHRYMTISALEAK